MLSDAKNSPMTPIFGKALLDAEQPMPAGIVGPDGQPAPKRFNVYRNNVIVSLCEALAQSFPAIERLVGEDYFKALARAFVPDNPPHSPVLLWYGEAFPDFIENFPPLAEYGYLVDVARLEWAWLRAYHAADAEPFDPSALGAIEPDQVGEVMLERHPAAYCIRSKWPVFSLVLANRFATDRAQEINLGEAESVLITRPAYEVQIQLMRPGSDLFFEALETKELQDAADSTAAAVPEFALAESLSDFLSAGAFSGLKSNRN